MLENHVCGDCPYWQENVFTKGQWIGKCDRDGEDYHADTPACDLFPERKNIAPAP
jgi:hypothetical protein